MKKILIFLMLLPIAGLLKAQNASTMEPITLSKPNLQRGENIMKALSERQSTRQYADRDLSLSDLSDLMWAAAGINRPESGKRTAPTAINRQEISVYVCMKNGNYLYDAKEHKLLPVSATDVRPVKAPVCLVIVGPEDFKYTPVDAGIVSQNISLFCAGVGLATVPRAMMDEDALKAALKLTDTHKPYLNHPVGYFVK